MAVSVGDILQATLQMRISNQVCLNIFHYEVENVPLTEVPYSTLLDEFKQHVWDDGIRTATSNLLFVEKAIIRNLTNGVDFLEAEYSGGGAISTSEPLPPQCSVTIRLLRTTLVTRNGYKRVTGVPEGQQNGGILNGAAVSLWSGVADVLDTAPTITTPSGFDWRLVIVGRTETGELDLSKINPVQGSVVSNRVGSQNTRKIKAT